MEILIDIELLIGIVIFLCGILVGVLIRVFFERRVKASGTIVIKKFKGRTLHSLELDEYPELLQFKRKVVFNVESVEEEPERD